VTVTGSEESTAKKLGVKIEARFQVGEYDIVVLGAEDSMGLDTWLRLQRYKIPPGAEPFLRPYVRAGMKFFVAKVDVKKVRFKDGQAVLSPLRFHYDTDSFALPVRLGLVNSAGTQDLIVHVLARGVRYEVANYENYAIPTNIDVADKVRDGFGGFYAALFDRMLALHPRAVITEYAWDSGNCDPCPTEPLSTDELATLGADVLPSVTDGMDDDGVDPSLMQNFVLTRLHVRYGKSSLGQDLVFRAAPAIEGGRGIPGQSGELPRGVQTADFNNFQGRYVIRHPWEGPVACEHPQRGVWGGPPAGVAQPNARGVLPALNLAFAPRGSTDLAALLVGKVPEVEGAEGALPLPKGPVKLPEIPTVHGGGCAGCALSDPDDTLPVGAAALLLALTAYFARIRWPGRGRCSPMSGKPR
jgi:hypothetical protein